jgi:hypothetical protein
MTANKFTWGDAIHILASSPHYFTGKYGSICGISKIDTQELASNFNEKIGTYIYVVEFNDGVEIEIPEHFLEKVY